MRGLAFKRMVVMQGNSVSRHASSVSVTCGGGSTLAVERFPVRPRQL